jgi:hypothetical protein
MKLSWCTSPCWELSKNTKNMVWNAPIWWIA